jgi:hypothetical protein
MFLTKRIERPWTDKISSFLVTDGETWLAASLFPFKVFVIAGVFAALGLRAMLPSYEQTWSWSMPPHELDGVQIIASATNNLDFREILIFTIFGYIFSSILLVIGALAQQLIYSNRAARWSLAFGVFALIIGTSLWIYTVQMPVYTDGACL